MKIKLQNIFIAIIILNSSYSLIILPLYNLHQKINISSSYQLINNILPNNLYTVIQGGNPPQNLELVISEEDIIFSIRKHNCLLQKYYYNKTASKSFKNITKEKSKSPRFYESIEAEDSFYFYKSDNDYINIKNNNIIKVDNFSFVFENEQTKNYNENNKKYNCAILSLNLFRNNIANNDYNFIIELKKLGIIENHLWTIKYISNNTKDDNLEGYLIIGDYPHIYEKDKFNNLNLRSCLNNMQKKGWNLEFRNITIDNDIILTHYLEGIISFSISYILGTEEYKSKIATNFFRDLMQKNICFEDNINSHYFVYYCKKGDFNETTIKNFPVLNLFHAEFNFTFKFSGNDLFLEKNGFYYFLIIFDRYNYKTWTFGKLFLNKYQLIFDHSSKKINFYINTNENKDIKSDEKKIYINNKILLIVIFSSIAIISFILGLFIGKRKFKDKKRNKRANEMDNEDIDYFVNKKESITDSNDATDISEEGIN